MTPAQQASLRRFLAGFSAPDLPLDMQEQWDEHHMGYESHYQDWVWTGRHA